MKTTTLNLVEFYTNPENGDVIYTRKDSNLHFLLKQNDRDIITEMLELISMNYPEAYEALENLFEKHSLNKMYYEFLIVKQFINCNLGNYDTNFYDIGANGDMMLEEVKCPLRGLCPNEGIVCKPTPVTLTTREVEVLSLIAQGYIAKEISTILNIAKETVDSHRKHMMQKIRCNTINQLIVYYVKYYKI